MAVTFYAMAWAAKAERAKRLLNATCAPSPPKDRRCRWKTPENRAAAAARCFHGASGRHGEFCWDPDLVNAYRFILFGAMNFCSVPPVSEVALLRARRLAEPVLDWAQLS